jgi:hypothetical protein
MSDLIFHTLGWSTLGIAVLVFGFAPGAALRLIVLLYRRDNLRRKELIGELYAVPRIERPFWVAEQLGWSRTGADISTWALTVILCLAAFAHFIGRGFHSEMTSEMRRLLRTEVAAPAGTPPLPNQLSRPPTSTVHAGWLILKREPFPLTAKMRGSGRE